MLPNCFPHSPTGAIRHLDIYASIWIMRLYYIAPESWKNVNFNVIEVSDLSWPSEVKSVTYLLILKWTLWYVLVKISCFSHNLHNCYGYPLHYKTLTGEVQIKFLRENQSSFLFPATDNIPWVPADRLTKLSPPSTDRRGMRLFFSCRKALELPKVLYKFPITIIISKTEVKHLYKTKSRSCNRHTHRQPYLCIERFRKTRTQARRFKATSLPPWTILSTVSKLSAPGTRKHSQFKCSFPPHEKEQTPLV